MTEFTIGVKAIIIHNKKALLMLRSRNRRSGKGCGEWEFPGGKVEFGENLHTTLRREIKEETGLEDICIGKLLYAMTAVVGPNAQSVGLMYVCYADSDAVTLSDEHLDFVWASKEQLVGLLNNTMLDELTENSVLDSLKID